MSGQDTTRPEETTVIRQAVCWKKPLKQGFLRHQSHFELWKDKIEEKLKFFLSLPQSVFFLVLRVFSQDITPWLFGDVLCFTREEALAISSVKCIKYCCKPREYTSICDMLDNVLSAETARIADTRNSVHCYEHTQFVLNTVSLEDITPTWAFTSSNA
jgi:hypothetical protein